MEDPSKKDYFVQWPNGTIYNQTIAAGWQYLWNFTNPLAFDYVVEATMKDLSDPAVDGSYMDDGPCEFPAYFDALEYLPEKYS